MGKFIDGVSLGEKNQFSFRFVIFEMFIRLDIRLDIKFEYLKNSDGDINL